MRSDKTSTYECERKQNPKEEAKLMKKLNHCPEVEILNIPWKDDHITLVLLSRVLIENCEWEHFLSIFGSEMLPKGEKLANRMGKVTFMVDGFNDDPREIYEIESIRKFYAGLNDVWPYWMFFCDLDNQVLITIAASILQNITSIRYTGGAVPKLAFGKKEWKAFRETGLRNMCDLCERAQIPEEKILVRNKELAAYFSGVG